MEDEEAVDHQVYRPHRSSFDCQFDVKRIFAKAGALDVFAPARRAGGGAGGPCLRARPGALVADATRTGSALSPSVQLT
eukprot:COSAG02_NODE_261_length_26663_cov_210.330899_2_plen_79_part_00